jgi:hypothetical protein
VITIKPVITEFQNRQKDIAREDKRPQKKGWNRFGRRTNAWEADFCESDSSESSDCSLESNDSLANIEAHMQGEEEEEIPSEQREWVMAAMSRMGKPKGKPICVICQKEGHVFRFCKEKRDKAAEQRIKVFLEELRRKRKEARAKAREEGRSEDGKTRFRKKEGRENQKKDSVKIAEETEDEVHSIEAVECDERDEYKEFFGAIKKQKSETDVAEHLFATRQSSIAIAELGDYEVGEMEELEEEVSLLHKTKRQLTDNEFDIRERNINPPSGLKHDLTHRDMQQIITSCYKASLEQERSPKNQKLYEECTQLAPMGRDKFKCEIDMTIGGLRIHNVLLDSGAQSNVISMGSITRLAALPKGGAFRTALATCKWTPPTTNHVVSGLGGHSMAVQGTVMLPIEVKGITYKLTFTLIHQPLMILIIGTAGLRMLKFKLSSPLFGNVNFLEATAKKQAEEKEEQTEDSSDSEKEAPVKALPEPKLLKSSNKKRKLQKLPTEEEPQKAEKKKSILKKKEDQKKEEPAAKRGRGRPRKDSGEISAEDKLAQEAKDPMVRALLGQEPLKEEEKQKQKKKKDFRPAGATKQM